MLGNERIGGGAMLAQFPCGAGLVRAHQPAVACHIGGEDRGKTAYDGLLHGLPQDRPSWQTLNVVTGGKSRNPAWLALEYPTCGKNRPSAAREKPPTPHNPWEASNRRLKISCRG